MTASPKAISSSTKLMDGNKALAALFAAATASANPMQPQRILTMPTVSQSSTPLKAKVEGYTEKACRPATNNNNKQQQQQSQTMSASNLISSLLNRSAQSSTSSSSSLPPTKTTATYTTTFAEPARATTSKASASVSNAAKPTTSKAGSSQKQQQQNHHHQPKPSVSSEIVNNPIELRNLESWFDEDAEKLEDSQYQELADSGEANGWSADEMFKYNEKRHKIMSSFNHRTLSGRYTTPLPKTKSKATADLATKLAAEIEERALLQGRVTPESSDDDEQFELERRRRIQQKQIKQLDQLKNLSSLNNDQQMEQQQQQQHRINNHSQKRRSSSGKQVNGSNDYRSPIASHNLGARKVSKPNSQLSDSSATPATTSSTSSSPRPIDSSIMSNTSTKSASSSRNILRTSLA